MHQGEAGKATVDASRFDAEEPMYPLQMHQLIQCICLCRPYPKPAILLIRPDGAVPLVRHSQPTQFGGCMNDNRIEGTAKQIKGSVKEAIGKVTGDKATQIEGAAEKLEGKVQANVGKATDAVKDRIKK
jgi:uncharacterized protein YjbJ (UPF0337 family)